jgi:predicted DCC family thiol-disulfide oxidoreductase YuxK
LVKALDRRERLGIVGFSHPLRAEVLVGMPDDVLHSGMHVVSTHGAVRTGGEAAITLLSLLPAPLRWIGVVAGRVGPVGRMMRWLYGAVAANRGRLARLVPDVAAVERLP